MWYSEIWRLNDGKGRDLGANFRCSEFDDGRKRKLRTEKCEWINKRRGEKRYCEMNWYLH